MQTHDTPVAGCLRVPGLGLVLLLPLLFVASVADAQEDLGNKNPFPLRPADTSARQSKTGVSMGKAHPRRPVCGRGTVPFRHSISARLRMLPRQAFERRTCCF